MRLLIDVQALQSGATCDRGIGRYCRGFVDAVAAARPAWRIELVQNTSLAPPARLPFHGMPNSFFSPPFSSAPAQAEANERYYADWLTAQAADAILLLSPFDSAVLAPRFTGPRPHLAIVLYDLSQLVFYDRYLQGAEELSTYARRFRLVLGADRILCVSAATARDLEGAAPDSVAAVRVVGGAAAPTFCPSGPADLQQSWRQVEKKFALDGDFLLCVGGGDPRKNLRGALEAFASPGPDRRRQLLLVVVGALTALERRSLTALAQALGIADSLRLVGYVADQTLVVLYQMCRLVLFPSLHEGLGLPVLEALQCGAPVVTSSCSALAECAGVVCRLADPRDPTAIAGAITAALAEPREAGRAERLRHASRFTWQRTAEIACGALEEPVRTRHATKDLPRIAWVSPLPPASSGVADYTAELVPHLTGRYEIELVIDRAGGVSPTLAQQHALIFADEVSQRHEARPYDGFVFQVGNSHYHAYMLDLMRRFRGLVVLHEIHLNGLITSWKRAGLWQGPTADGAEERLFHLAGGIIVHSAWAWRRVRPKASGPVWVVPQAVPTPKPGTREEARQRLCLPADDFIVATLGLVRPAKRVASIIRALAALSAGGGARLLVVGHVDANQERELTSLAKQAGVGSQVSFVGRVPLAEFTEYARAANVCVQLRNPSLGETSAALLRALAAGGTCVVSDDGPMAEFPEDVALRVPGGGAEIEGLTRALRRLQQVGPLPTTMGQAAAGYCQAYHSLFDTAHRFAAALQFTIHDRQARGVRWVEGVCDGLASAGDPAIVESLIDPWVDLRRKGQSGKGLRPSCPGETEPLSL